MRNSLKTSEKQAYYGLRSATLQLIRRMLRGVGGFIWSTESFVGNMAEIEIIVDAILHYFHGPEPTYVAK